MRHLGVGERNEIEVLLLAREDDFRLAGGLDVDSVEIVGVEPDEMEIA